MFTKRIYVSLFLFSGSKKWSTNDPIVQFDMDYGVSKAEELDRFSSHTRLWGFNGSQLMVSAREADLCHHLPVNFFFIHGFVLSNTKNKTEQSIQFRLCIQISHQIGRYNNANTERRRRWGSDENLIINISVRQIGIKSQCMPYLLDERILFQNQLDLARRDPLANRQLQHRTGPIKDCQESLAIRLMVRINHYPHAYLRQQFTNVASAIK